MKHQIEPSVRPLLIRGLQLAIYPLAKMFPKNGVGQFISIAFILAEALAQQTTSFSNVDCCAVKKVEGKESPSIL